MLVADVPAVRNRLSYAPNLARPLGCPVRVSPAWPRVRRCWATPLLLLMYSASCLHYKRIAEGTNQAHHVITGAGVPEGLMGGEDAGVAGR